MRVDLTPAAFLAVALGWSGTDAMGQSLFRQPSAPPESAAAVDPAEPLYDVSLIAIEPPEPRQFAPHDLITILVTEESRFERNQTLETEKEYENSIAMLNSTLLRQFLELRLPAPGTNLEGNDLALSDREFESEGEYEREDLIQAQITARVLEVKPNGTLLLEARTTLQTDEEMQTFTLSGLCRSEDVTQFNTVRSSQLFNLDLNVQHEGQVRESTKKGLIPRVIETIFNF